MPHGRALATRRRQRHLAVAAAATAALRSKDCEKQQGAWHDERGPQPRVISEGLWYIKEQTAADGEDRVADGVRYRERLIERGELAHCAKCGVDFGGESAVDFLSRSGTEAFRAARRLGQRVTLHWERA